MRTAEGTKVFTKDEWLTSTQISRYFGRLAALNRSGALQRTQEARPAPTEPVPEEGESEMRRKTYTWLKLSSLQHGFKSIEARTVTFYQSVYLFDHIYFDFSL